ncbi:hypothetical protein [Streptomyces sp. bgisy100]|uniref:hypothetical protein n=1 Tax=Streptomyces sp. bgisy100 TaxID=3413783 RepID=UPI003D7329FF
MAEHGASVSSGVVGPEVAGAEGGPGQPTPDTVTFAPWIPLPAGIPRGPYTRPDRELLKRHVAGLEWMRDESE